MYDRIRADVGVSFAIQNMFLWQDKYCEFNYESDADKSDCGLAVHTKWTNITNQSNSIRLMKLLCECLVWAYPSAQPFPFSSVQWPDDGSTLQKGVLGICISYTYTFLFTIFIHFHNMGIMFKNYSKNIKMFLYYVVHCNQITHMP